jgi:hypothetical protein
MKQLISGLLFIFCFSAFTQTMGPSMTFLKEMHSFGIISETGGTVNYTFEFVNTGNEPVILNAVRSSCGCTAPDWSKAPVLPGAKGYIKVTFDPANRPGKFEKTITVSANIPDNPDKVLRIMGVVTPKPEDVGDTYPRDMNGFRLTTNHLAFGKVHKNQIATKTINVINTNSNPIKVTFTNVPAYCKIKTIPELLKPNEEGKLEVVYDGTATSNWGFTIDKIMVVINGKTNNSNQFTISADIGEDFSRMSPEEKLNGPKIKFDTTVFDFGSIEQDISIDYKFKFTNIGKSDLIIRKINSTCGCTVVEPEKETLAPGESSSLKVVFNSGKRSGMQNKIVTIITNDPNTPITRLYVKGSVVGKLGTLTDE